MALVFEGPCTLLGAHYIMWAVWYCVHSFERARPACGKQLSRSLVLQFAFVCLLRVVFEWDRT